MLNLDSPGAASTSPTQTRQYVDLPGPKALPLVGNGHQLEKHRLHEQLEGWSHEYGSPFRLSVGPRRMMVLSDHAVIASVLRDRPERFRRPTHHGDIVREMGFEQGLFFANDETWRRQRRLVMSALDPRHVKAYFATLLVVAGRLQGRWMRAARMQSDIDLQADLMRYTVDAIAGLAFGSDVNTLEAEDAIQQHLNRIFPAIARRATQPFPYWRYLKLPADRRLDASVRVVKGAIEGFIDQARVRLSKNPDLRMHPSNLLEAMIVAADEEGSDENRRDIAGNVFMMLVAGEDTTANTLAWMLELLYRNPEAMVKAQEEVQRVLPAGSEFTPESLSQLPYIDACINETMRLKPVAPLLAAQAIRATAVAGVDIPANTIVLGLMRHDATDDRHFRDPLKFDPQRWLDKDGPAGLKSATRVSMPFGAGPRLCPGRYLALMEMKLAIAMLLREFSIDRVATTDNRPARELFAFAMGPVGLRMRLSELRR